MSNKEEIFADNIISEVLKIPFVRVNRSEFLIKTFGNNVDDTNKLLEEGPQSIFTKNEMDKKAQNRINFVTTKSSAVSFATGIPGGIAMAATIPADIAQFYAYSLRLAQEISYIYGYKDIWNEQGELCDQAKNTLILYLGIMLGVSSAASLTRVLSSKLSSQAIKKIPQKALTKTFYYPTLKKILAIFGTKLTKASFAKGVSKVIPVIGGAISGGINFASMRPMALRLKNELSQSIHYTEEDLKRDLRILNKEEVNIVDSKNDKEKKMMKDDIEPDNIEDIYIQIEKAYELLEANIITESEFSSIKKALLNNI